MSSLAWLVAGPEYKINKTQKRATNAYYVVALGLIERDARNGLGWRLGEWRRRLLESRRAVCGGLTSLGLGGRDLGRDHLSGGQRAERRRWHGLSRDLRRRLQLECNKQRHSLHEKKEEARIGVQGKEGDRGRAGERCALPRRRAVTWNIKGEEKRTSTGDLRRAAVVLGEFGWRNGLALAARTGVWRAVMPFKCGDEATSEGP